MDQFNFSKKDIEQIKETGQTPDKINSQLSLFHRGTPFVKLDRPCTVDDGITKLSDEMIRQCMHLYETRRGGGKLIKFVPASGAATRMFKKLIHAYHAKQAGKDASINGALSRFMKNCHRFAFRNDLRSSLAKEGLRLDDLIADQDSEPILRHLLTQPYLNYAMLPKALIKFHSYPDHARTAFEEHLVEAAGYVRTDANDCALHFTVPPRHKERFVAFYEKIRTIYEKQRNTNYEVTFSTQKISTNTIAVDMQNRPFRLPDDSLLFRPGGHGALIHNLNQLTGDIVFIKNIDNVVHERFGAEITEWKKILCGNLIRLQQQIFDFLNQLHHNTLGNPLIENIRNFIKKELFIRLPQDFSAASDTKKQKILIRLLDRPLRVCGMVQNTGDPGGGPFWLQGPKDMSAPQIVEMSQINIDDPHQKSILNQLKHFNPVDLVCGIRNWQGKLFNLPDYVDHQAVFIANKSENGRDLKALELPGLWNGAMAFWNTVFVEVPKITFNPVKEVTDLLAPHHQPDYARP